MPEEDKDKCKCSSIEAVWLTQDRVVELFGVQHPATTNHLKNIFESGELEETAVCSILERTAVLCDAITCLQSVHNLQKY